MTYPFHCAERAAAPSATAGMTGPDFRISLLPVQMRHGSSSAPARFTHLTQPRTFFYDDSADDTTCVSNIWNQYIIPFSICNRPFFNKNGQSREKSSPMLCPCGGFKRPPEMPVCAQSSQDFRTGRADGGNASVSYSPFHSIRLNSIRIIVDFCENSFAVSRCFRKSTPCFQRSI